MGHVRVPLLRSLATLVATLILLALSASAAVANDDDSTSPKAARTTVTAERILDPTLWGVGTRLDDFAVADLDGRIRKLSDYAGEAVVLVLRDADCPLCKRYGPRLAEFEQEWRKKGVRFLYVNVQAADTAERMAEDRKTHGLKGPYVADRDRGVQRVLRARTTTEVFVVDGARTLRYRGAVDDQYGIGSSRPEPRQHFLRDALERVTAREAVEIEATTAPGCALAEVDPPAAPKAITFHEHVERIVQRKCQSCHRDGGAAPFALETFEQVRGRRGMIEFMVEESLMPPWSAAEHTGPWANDPRLSEREKAQLLAWIEQDAPRGEPATAPQPRSWPDRWLIGKPDLVVPIPNAFDVPAQGVVSYRYAYVQLPTEEDRWIERMEIRPTQPQVVHHVLVFLEAPTPRNASREQRRRRQEGLRGYFAGMVPGQSTTEYPAGLGKKLPAGAWLKFQIHYTPNGVATQDRTEIGFVFADGPPAHEMLTSAAAAVRFEIPPGDPEHAVTARYRFREDGHLVSFAPHMHLRGKAFRYDLRTPDGKVTTLLEVPRFDFDWQYRYRWVEPRAVEKGSVLEVTGVFDNSPENPANPDPTATVRFGEQTFDEMMIGYFEWYRGASTP